MYVAPLGRAREWVRQEVLDESEVAHQLENDVDDLHISLLPSLRVPHQARQGDSKQRSRNPRVQQRDLVEEVTEQELGVIRALLARIEFLEFLDRIDRLGHGSCEVSGGERSRMALAGRFEEDGDEDEEATSESENAGNAVISVIFARKPFLKALG